MALLPLCDWRLSPRLAAGVTEAMNPVPCFLSGSQAAYITQIPDGGRESVGRSGSPTFAGGDLSRREPVTTTHLTLSRLTGAFIG